MLGTPMPEATVNLDGDSRTGEHDVWPAGQASVVDAVAEASSMEFAPNGKLRLCASGALAGHERSYLRAGSRWTAITLVLGDHT